MVHAMMVPLSLSEDDGGAVAAMRIEAFSRECLLKVIGIRPMAPVLKTGPHEVFEHEMLSFSVRKEIIKNDNSLVVILLCKVVENEFLQTL